MGDSFLFGYYDAADGYLVKFEKPMRSLFQRKSWSKGGITKKIKTMTASARNILYFDYDNQNYQIDNDSNNEKLSYILHYDPKVAGGQNTKVKSQWTRVIIPKNFTLIMMGENALKGFIGESNLKDLRSLVDQQGNRSVNYPMAVEKLSSFIYTPEMDVESIEEERSKQQKLADVKPLIVYARIGKDGELRDLPALNQLTMAELIAAIRKKFSDVDGINGEFAVMKEGDLPVTEDTTVNALSQDAKLTVVLKHSHNP